MTFSEQLRGLWAAAGNPTLAAVSEAVAVRGRPAGITVPRSFVARLSDWRNGKHLPREFDGLLLLTIAELLDRARSRDGLGSVPARMSQWERLWRNEREADAADVACPYPGLASYGPEAAARFFGRDTQIAAITGLVDEALAEGGGIVALVGVSGSGKSSLLAAGVGPALAQRGVHTVSMTPGADPRASLERALSGAADRPLVLMVDQAEELFTVAEAAGALTFLETLADLTGAADSPIVVLIGLRADFVGEWVRFPRLLEAMNKRTYLLGPMNRAELEQVVTAPAATVGVKFDPGLTERILAEFAGQPNGDWDAGALPLLNHTLATLWAHRDGNRLTRKALDAAGGVFGALDETAERLWAGLDPAAQREAQRLLLRLVHVDEAGRYSRVQRARTELLAGPDESAPARAEALEALLGSRLLMVDGDEKISFTHEIVMRVWERLRLWIDENRADLLARQQLEASAQEWQRAARDRSLLLRGASLERAHSAAGSGEISAEAAAFVSAADGAQQRGIRRRRGAIAALAVATVLGLLLSVIAFQSRTEAVDQRNLAELGRLVSEADRLRTSDPTLSARLTQLAADRYPTEVNRSRLVGTGNLPLAVPVNSAAGAVYTVDVSPDGKTVAGTSSDGAARIWRLDDPDAEPVELQGHSGFLTSVAWSPDGAALATTSDDGTARIWPQPGTAAAPVVLSGHRGRVVYAAWAPDGRRLVTAGMDGTVRVWDTGSGRQLAELNGHTADVRTVAWSPDGALIASGGSDRTARLWDGDSYAPRGVMTGYRDTVHALDFRGDGAVLATGADDATVQLYDVAAPDAPKLLGIPVSAHTAPVWSVRFSADGRRLISASLDGTAHIWSVSRPESVVQVGDTLDGAAVSLFSADLTPDGRRAVTSGADGRILIWTLPGTVLAGHLGRVVLPAVAGDRMLTGGSGGTAMLWDIADPTEPRLLDSAVVNEAARIDEVTLSPDGALAAAAAGNSTVQVWPVAGGRFGTGTVLPVQTQDRQTALFSPTRPLLLTGARDNSYQLWEVAAAGTAAPVGPPLVAGETGWATAAAWSPDGQELVTAAGDGTVTLWDVADPAQPRRLGSAPAGVDGTVNALSWAGDIVVAGGDGGVLQFWRAEDGELEPLAQVTQERRGTVRSLDFSADGSRLISAGDGQTLVVWDTTDPAAPRQWGEPIGPAAAGRSYGALTADGGAALVGGDHGALSVVVLDPDYADRRIDEASRPLTADQQARFGIR